MLKTVKMPNINNFGLSAKVMSVMLLILGSLLAILIIVARTNIQEFAIQTSHVDILQEATRVQVHIEEAEQAMLNDLSSLVLTPGLAEAIENQSPDLLRLILLTNARNFDFDEISLYDKDGEIISQSNPSHHAGAQEASLIDLALLGIEQTGLITDDSRQKLNIGVVSPIRNAQGNIIGALFGNRDIDTEFLNQINPVTEKFVLAAVNNGAFASDQQDAEHTDSLASIPLDSNLLTQSLEGQTVIDEDVVYAAEKPYSLVYSPLTIGGETKASILIFEEISDRLALQGQITLSIGITITILAMVTLVLISTVLRHIVIEPLSQLANTSQKFGQGDLSARTQLKSRDEIGVLAESFNSMAGELQSTMQDMDRTLEERTKTLETLAAEVKVRKQIEEQLRHDAFHDALTDLPNRSLFFERLEQAILRNRRNNEHQFAVMFLDLDRFKLVNDSLGHNFGDELLITVAKRLSGCMRAIDTVARMGGDEFAILLDEIKDTNEVELIAERIHASLEEPVEIKGKTLHISANLGMVVTNPLYKDSEDYLRDADLAMYHAKKQFGQRSSLFSSTLRQETDLRVQLEADLRNAIELQELVLHYQPIFDIKQKSIIGCEALLRWMHPQLGLIAPGTFIPLAEETGLIIPIGYWVIETACQQARMWSDQFPHHTMLNMSVNVSANQLAETDFADNVLQILEKTNLSPKYLSIEVTESTIVADTGTTVDVLEKLKVNGISIHMDDFGTGYAALGQLRKYPLDHLKIDRSFIDSMNIKMDDPGLVRAIISMAKEFNLQVIAEGVETEGQLEMLSDLGCDLAQGFLYSEPLPEGDMRQLLMKENKKPQLQVQLG